MNLFEVEHDDGTLSWESLAEAAALIPANSEGEFTTVYALRSRIQKNGYASPDNMLPKKTDLEVRKMAGISSGFSRGRPKNHYLTPKEQMKIDKIPVGIYDNI